MKIGSYLKICLMIFISSLIVSSIYGVEKVQTRKDMRDDSLKLKDSQLIIDGKTCLAVKDPVYGQCPCGHPTVTPDVECTVPGCPYSKRDD